MEQLQENVVQLERDKEHWMLEFKLLQRRYEKATSANSTIPQQSSSDSGLPSSSNTSTNKTSSSGASNLDESGENRERLIKKHFSDKMAELSRQLQLTDSKAVHFYSEVCHSLTANHCILACSS